MYMIELIPLIIPAMVTFMLIVLIIKERGYLFKSKPLKEINLFRKRMKDNPDKEDKRNSSKKEGGFVDFSGGIWGI